jgi:hypothetical protein
MQKYATIVFICSSLAFGMIGVLFVLTLPYGNETSSDINMVLTKLLTMTVFIILPSFALSVAGKYLKGKS